MFSNWLTQRQSFFKVPRTKASEQMKKKRKKRRSYKKNPPTICRRLALSNEIPKLRHWLAARNVGSRDLEPIKRLILFSIQSLNSILEKFFLFSRELVYVRINISSTTWNGYTDENQENRLFFNETTFLFSILVSRTLKTGKFKLLYFRNETCYGNGNLYKDLLFVYLQPSVNKNS